MIATNDADGRHDRLARGTAGLRRRNVPIDRWLQIAGAVAVPLGALLIFLGWYGASHTTRVWEQMPYVVSGGMLGTALVFVGAFCYFAQWLTKLVQQSRQQAADAQAAAERTAEALERIEQMLRTGTPGTKALSALETQAVAASDHTIGRASLVATGNGAMIHLPDCPMIQGKANVREVAPDEPGLRPCLVCEPNVAPSTSGRGRDRSRA